ncbi:MAG: hypothetical protein ACRC2V_10575 [Xenococcaceae cyanobacterium]
MSLQKGALIVGGGSLQTYLKDGNNLHTEFVEEWILIEDQNLLKNTSFYWRLSDRNFDIRLVGLWATTTGNITINIQSRGVNLFPIVVTNVQAASGYNFSSLIVPSKYDLAISCPQDITKLFLIAKQISICENFPLSR